MLIKNAKKTDGNWDFDLQLLDVEVDYLVNLAVANLLHSGVLHIEEQEAEQEVSLASGNETLN